MSQGFLGYHATFMLDVVVCALVLLVPALAVSIYLVKVRRQYAWHRRLQLTLGGVLLLTVAAFEVDVQFVHHGWQNIVKDARPDMAAESLDFARKVLYVHLVFAISTPLLWILTIGLALAKFGNPSRNLFGGSRFRWPNLLPQQLLIDQAIEGCVALGRGERVRIAGIGKGLDGQFLLPIALQNHVAVNAGDYSIYNLTANRRGRQRHAQR